MFSQPAKANRPNLMRRIAAADEALHHAVLMCLEIIDQGKNGERRRDRRAEQAIRSLTNAAAWIASAKTQMR